MDKIKAYILQARQFLANFQKVKKKKAPGLKRVNKKTINYLVLGGIGFLLFVGLSGAVRAISLSNQVSSLKDSVEQAKNQATTDTSSDKQIDNRLQYYLNDYVYAYFTLPSEADKQQAQVDYLNKFYNAVPDTKSQGQTRNPSEFLSAQLVTVDGNIATYRVRYKETIRHDNNSEEKEVTTAFNIPFDQKKDKYYVSGLPWFSTIQSSQAGGFDEHDKVELSASDSFSESQRNKLTKFLTVFFTNYTTNQDNLNLISKDISVVANSTFKTIDYTYFKQSGKQTIAYVQATFEVAGSTHSENFTFTLSSKDNSFYVDSLEHTIPKDYANDKE